jgi:hypothetical protein
VADNSPAAPPGFPALDHNIPPPPAWSPRGDAGAKGPGAGGSAPPNP